MRKRSLVLTLSVLAVTTLVITVSQISIAETKERLQEGYETKIQQLSIYYEADLERIEEEKRELQETNEELIEQDIENKSKIQKKNDKIKKLEEKLNETEDELNLINGHLDIMSSIIQEESYPKMSEEQADEVARHVWKLNNTYRGKFGFEFDPYLTLAFMAVESDFNPKAESYAEAKGITQLLDSTGKEYAEKLGYTTYNPFDWKQNVNIGWYYFNTNRARYGKHKAIVIYNQGYRNLSKAVTYSLKSPTSYLNNILQSEEKFKSYN